MKPVITDPGATARAQAYALWMDAPNPMVTFFKTLDVTPLVRLSRRKGLKFNMLLCWCIGRYRRRFLKTTLTVSFQFHHPDGWCTCRALPGAGAAEHPSASRFGGVEFILKGKESKATPRNCVCEPQPSFCPTSSV